MPGTSNPLRVLTETRRHRVGIKTVQEPFEPSQPSSGVLMKMNTTIHNHRSCLVARHLRGSAAP